MLHKHHDRTLFWCLVSEGVLEVDPLTWSGGQFERFVVDRLIETIFLKMLACVTLLHLRSFGPVHCWPQMWPPLQPLPIFLIHAYSPSKWAISQTKTSAFRSQQHSCQLFHLLCAADRLEGIGNRLVLRKTFLCFAEMLENLLGHKMISRRMTPPFNWACIQKNQFSEWPRLNGTDQSQNSHLNSVVIIGASTMDF